MYQTKISGDTYFHAQSEGYGKSIELFWETKDGDTPMSLMTIALGSCVTMCLQSYFKKKKGLDTLDIIVETTYEDRHFDLKIDLPDLVKDTNQDELTNFINNYCRVKKVLADDITFSLKYL